MLDQLLRYKKLRSRPYWEVVKIMEISAKRDKLITRANLAMLYEIYERILG